MLTNLNIFFKVILIVLFCHVYKYNVAQTKSKDIQTINGEKYYIHKVEKGQSLYAISKLYETDINGILSENQEATNGLKTGQDLKILIAPYVSKIFTPIILDTTIYQYHKVQKGETIYAITKKYNIDEQKLKTFNPTITIGIKEGDNLIISEKKINKTNSTTAINTTATVKSPSLTSVKSTTVSVSLVTLKDTLKFNKPKKIAYNLGLLLPFKLDQLEVINIDELAKNKNGFPNSQSLAIDFYAGFKKIVDSLSSKDFDLKITLFDVDEQDSAKIESICKSNEFKQLDVVFGPLYASVFKTVAKYTKLYNIPTISPLTQQNKILFSNPLVSKFTPSQVTLIESLADYCSDSLSVSSNVILVNTTAKDLAYLNTFKQRYALNLKLKNKSLKDSLTIAKGIAGVKGAYVMGKKNIVIVLTNNQVYLQDFITQLYVSSDKKDVVLMGFNNVANIDNLDQGYLNELHFHFASNNAIDYTNSSVQQLVKHYQEIYFSDPSEYYFDGFDIGNYYLTNLKNQGPNFFLNLDKYPASGVGCGFKFYRPDAETGFENRAVFIFKYDDFKVQQLGWK